ncbi:conserved hypothetical protein [Ricinus communis]|uniref:Uncharacterized protein n=1 Tax=Ricinus communis TaxID=3988 RepID=B9RPF7_RICCO|nr:conserved hypothetical protein [Ricinus communis]
MAKAKGILEPSYTSHRHRHALSRASAFHARYLLEILELLEFIFHSKKNLKY